MILQYDNVGHSPAWPFIPHAQVELDSVSMYFQPAVGPTYSDPCLIMFNEDDEVMGYLVYQSDSRRSTWWIALAYTLPGHRRKGVHSALFTALVERAKLRGDILAIESGTHVNNKAAQAAFEKQGRIPISISYAYDIKNWVDGKPYTEIKK